MPLNLYEVISMVKKGNTYHATVYRTRFLKRWPWPLRFEVSGRDSKWAAQVFAIKIDHILLRLLRKSQARFEGESVEVRKQSMFPWMGRK